MSRLTSAATINKMPLRWWPSARTLIWFGFGSTKRSRRRRYSKTRIRTNSIDLKIAMFVYRPSKGMCWGHGLRPKDTNWQVAKRRLDAFLNIYFDLVEERHIGSSKWRWKNSALPHVAWPEDFLRPENQKWQNIDIGFLGERVSFIFGLRFPLSIHDPSSTSSSGDLARMHHSR
jgi:hypothetical protein